MQLAVDVMTFIVAKSIEEPQRSEGVVPPKEVGAEFGNDGWAVRIISQMYVSTRTFGTPFITKAQENIKNDLDYLRRVAP